MRHVGGQMQPGGGAATTLYESTGPGMSGGDAGDAAVMARWLQSAGLQHLASPVASNAVDHRVLPNLLMQGYGPQSAEEKQRLFKLMRNLNFNRESVSDPYNSSAQSSGAYAMSDGFYSPEFRGDFGAGLLDLHSMDDTELLSDHVMSEPFEPSPFMPTTTTALDTDFDEIAIRQQQVQPEAEVPTILLGNENENSSRENNVAKIKVVVRKRPLNKKEISRKEDDVVTVLDDSFVTLHEPKLKVDLTAYVEKHEFCFDAVLDEHVTNDEVYRNTVELIIPTIFQRTKATCFAYGQTGSGKTYTMQPLPLRAAEDLVRMLHQPIYRNQNFKLWLSYFEIYGGKLFDLLSDRKKLCMREDGRQQVCIVGLQEFEVLDVQIVKEYIEKGNAARSTGSTGANEESSRSHAILQLAVKKHVEVKESRRNIDSNDPRKSKVVGKISFIDLAGSERGADTTDNDRQTRIEGAEINKSLLALKECIRALDNDQIHIPFRGSKLTEVLRDSFVGNSRTVMISCISPNAGSCEHTLNTLRYADRVKSLSKSGNPRKDIPAVKDPSLAQTLSVPSETEEVQEPHQEMKTAGTSGRVLEKESTSYSVSNDGGKIPSSYEENKKTSTGLESERLDIKNTYKGSTNQKPNTFSYSHSSANVEEKVQKVSPTRRKAYRDSQGSADVEEKVQKVSPPRRKAYRDDKIYSLGSADVEEMVQKVSPPRRKAYRDDKSYSQGSADVEEKVQKVSPPRRKVYRDEKLEKPGYGPKKESDNPDTQPYSYKRQNMSSSNATSTSSKLYELEPQSPQERINEILEEEEALIVAHRKEIEDTMEIVREEMKLLAEVDQPGSHIDNYVTQLNFVLSRKTASLVSLQARLARFQHRLKEQEVLSRKRVPR